MAGEVEVLVGLLGHVDAKKEAERIERSLKKIEKDMAGLDKRLQNPKFAANAPPEVVAEVREQRDALDRQRGRLEEARGLVAELDG
jgi:valyl-tRNA synthetase